MILLCKCGRSPTELTKITDGYVCPCGNGFTPDPGWERSIEVARAVEEVLADSHHSIVRKILARLA